MKEASEDKQKDVEKTSEDKLQTVEKASEDKQKDVEKTTSPQHDNKSPFTALMKKRPLSRSWTIAAIGIVIIIVVGATQLIRMPANQTTSAAQATPVPHITVPAHQLYDPVAPAALQGNTVNVNLEIKETMVTIAPGVAYRAWTFNGTVPGPVIRVKQGQTVHFTLINHGSMQHSIDFHAAETPWNVNYQSIPANSTFSFDWVSNYAGVFLYHCGSNPVIAHLVHGMYGMIIVDPAKGFPHADKEYAIVQSEFYTKHLADGSYSGDVNKALSGSPDYVTFNGYSNQYVEHPLTVKEGQRIRIFIGNPGPNHFSAIHVIGALIKDVYADGNLTSHTTNAQTITIPPGGASIIELVIPKAGQYPLITHVMSDLSKGGLGLIQVTK